ncbi:ethanolamine ammonia-lyase subunit EutC [Fulvimarina sp. 2208YS6-2-32]|uniref:Ethanolamine ammonia-lyase small subunit n=1 Tax=Fulvimarina uroteuthidis TaxID=3098149 RepID=A0ABU5I6Q5_9HYPH|nr:ethanolamine ammonia-lyase subunit EutC [Fulvimarina sp. 2208YS6-2-32]MDY8111052.1 ethanolamine ammonia-lyase subunit EutC [Fulvimarina sp. 2208YS6-2-32]
MSTDHDDHGDDVQRTEHERGDTAAVALAPAIVAPPDRLTRLKDRTDARIALGRARSGLPTAPHLRFALDHAMARDAVHSALDIESLSASFAALGFEPFRATSQAGDRTHYLARPDLGRLLDVDSRHELEVEAGGDLAIVVADGLSATAVNLNAVETVEALKTVCDLDMRLVLATGARVALGDHIAIALSCETVLVLIGERPGLSAADSLGAYVTHQPRPDMEDAERFCVSNIRSGGLKPRDAARRIADLIETARERGYAGVTRRDEAKRIED